MRKLFLLIAFCLFLMPAAALADTVDFSSGGGGGTWSWGGTVGSSLFGNVGGPLEANSTPLAGSTLSWTTGLATFANPAALGTPGAILGTFGSGGTLTILDGGGTFTGTLVGGTVIDSGGGGVVIYADFVDGNFNSTFLSTLGLPSVPSEYSGALTVHLTVGTCPTDTPSSVTVAPLCGTWDSADLGLNPVVPEPGSLALFGTGLLGMAGYLRRKVMSR